MVCVRVPCKEMLKNAPRKNQEFVCFVQNYTSSSCGLERCYHYLPEKYNTMGPKPFGRCIQGRGLRSLFDLHSLALDFSVHSCCCKVSAALLDPTLCKQPKICLKHQCLGHLHNVGSGNDAETEYSATYKHCSLKLN